MSDLKQIKADFIERVKAITHKAISFKDSLLQYAYLWKDDRQERMRQFLIYGRFLTEDEQLKLLDSRLAVNESAPTIDNFKEKVSIYIYDLIHTFS